MVFGDRDWDINRRLFAWEIMIMDNDSVLERLIEEAIRYGKQASEIERLRSGIEAREFFR